MKPITKRIPVSACQLRSGPFFLSDDGDGDEVDGQKKSPPTARILARSGSGIEHWFWGTLVHDMAGMELVKDRLPLDYCHDQADILGYAEGWDRESGDLTCTGTLLVDQSENAASIVALARAGVPYEASISFTPIAIEELGEGQAATVNGRLVDGPASVIRRWRLTGLAVCPRGADPNTKTELSAKAGEIEVSILKGADMAEKIETPEEIAARVEQQLTGRITDYCTRFGQQGQTWALSSRPLADCYADLVTQLRDQHAAELTSLKAGHAATVAELQQKLDAQTGAVTELTERLEAVQLGETKPVSTAPASGATAAETELAARLTGRLPEGIARFAAGIKMPKS